MLCQVESSAALPSPGRMRARTLRQMERKSWCVSCAGVGAAQADGKEGGKAEVEHRTDEELAPGNGTGVRPVALRVLRLTPTSCYYENLPYPIRPTADCGSSLSDLPPGGSLPTRGSRVPARPCHGSTGICALSRRPAALASAPLGADRPKAVRCKARSPPGWLCHRGGLSGNPGAGGAVPCVLRYAWIVAASASPGRMRAMKLRQTGRK